MSESAVPPLNERPWAQNADLTPEVQALAVLVAQFAADQLIPWDLLRADPTALPPPLADIATDMQWEALAESLDEASPVSVTASGISVPADTRVRILTTLDQTSVLPWNRLALGLVNAAFPEESSRFDAWAPCERLVDHARAVIGNVGPQTDGENDAARIATGLLARVVAYLLARGQLAAARDSLRLSERLERRGVPADDAALTAFMRATAGVLMMEDRVDAAIGVLRKALESDSRARPGSVDEAKDRIALAHAYSTSDDFERARDEARAGLELLEQLGDEPAETVVALLRLGWILSEQGAHAEAIALITRGRELAVTTFGPHDPATLGTGNDLAFALLNADRIEEARPILEAALRDLEEMLGPDHPKTCATHSNLGYVLLRLGDASAAFTHCKAALDAAIQTFPKNHRHRLNRRRGLVHCLSLLGDGDAEREQRERLVEETAERHGIEAFETTHEIQQLARVCHAIGDLDDAVRFYEAALAHHPVGTDSERRDVAGLLVDLALALRATNRPFDAVQACRRALELLADTDDAERLRPRLALAGLLQGLTDQLAPALELLDRAPSLCSANVLDDLVADALAASPVDLHRCVEIAGISTAVGAVDAAAAALEAAVAIPNRPPASALKIAAAFRVLGDALRTVDRLTDADRAWRSALGLLEGIEPAGSAVARERWLNLRALGALDEREVDDRHTVEDPLESITAAVEASRGTGRPRDLVIALMTLGRAFLARDRAADAEPALREALAVSEHIVPRDKYSEGVQLHDLGRALANLGDAAAALDAFERALAYKHQAREQEGRSDNDIAITATAFARMLRESERPTEAIAVLSDVANGLSDESARDREIAAAVFAELGQAHNADGDLDAAAAAYLSEVRYRERLLDAERLFAAVHRLGRTLERLERFDTALDTYRRALSLAGQIAASGTRIQGIVWHDIGDVLGALGQHEEATDAYRRALEHKRAAAGAAADNVGLAGTMLCLARSLITLQRWDEAQSVLLEQLDGLQAWPIRDELFEGVTLHDIAEVHEARGDLDAAVDAYREAAARKRASQKDPEDLAFTLVQLAATLRQAGRDDEAYAAEADAAAVEAALRDSSDM